MAKFLLIAVLVIIVWKMLTGRWPWEKRLSTRSQAQIQARKLLAVRSGASREEIIAAHKRLITMVHPDRGGSNAQVHEADAARDLLLNDLPDYPKERS